MMLLGKRLEIRRGPDGTVSQRKSSSVWQAVVQSRAICYWPFACVTAWERDQSLRSGRKARHISEMRRELGQSVWVGAQNSGGFRLHLTLIHPD